MTPTEQDKELREAIINIVEAEYKSPNCIPAVERVEHIMQLITADRKRVALETLLDVKNNSEEAYVGEDWWSDDNVMDNSAYEIPRLYLDNRIAELKAQQEELWHLQNEIRS